MSEGRPIIRRGVTLRRRSSVSIIRLLSTIGGGTPSHPPTRSQSSDRMTSSQGESPKSSNAAAKWLARSEASFLTDDIVGFAFHVLVNCPESPDLEVTPGRMISAI